MLPCWRISEILGCDPEAFAPTFHSHFCVPGVCLFPPSWILYVYLGCHFKGTCLARCSWLNFVPRGHWRVLLSNILSLHNSWIFYPDFLLMSVLLSNTRNFCRPHWCKMRYFVSRNKIASSRLFLVRFPVILQNREWTLGCLTYFRRTLKDLDFVLYWWAGRPTDVRITRGRTL
jgi:hypothetical protein